MNFYFKVDTTSKHSQQPPVTSISPHHYKPIHKKLYSCKLFLHFLNINVKCLFHYYYYYKFSTFLHVSQLQCTKFMSKHSLVCYTNRKEYTIISAADILIWFAIRCGILLLFFFVAVIMNIMMSFFCIYCACNLVVLRGEM